MSYKIFTLGTKYMEFINTVTITRFINTRLYRSLFIILRKLFSDVKLICSQTFFYFRQLHQSLLVFDGKKSRMFFTLCNGVNRGVVDHINNRSNLCSLSLSSSENTFQFVAPFMVSTLYLGLNEPGSRVGVTVMINRLILLCNECLTILPGLLTYCSYSGQLGVTRIKFH